MSQVSRRTEDDQHGRQRNPFTVLVHSRDDTAIERATVDLYERRAAEWARRRPPRRRAEARALATAITPGTPRLDAGCGPGSYTPDLGEPVVALDAAFAMLELARARAPHAALVQADLEALPFRHAVFGGVWARASYVHVPRVRLPLALRELQVSLTLGAPATLVLRRGHYEGAALPGDDFGGRFFACWEPEEIGHIVEGAGFDIDDLAADEEWIRVRARRGRLLPDTVTTGMRLLVVGLNPSLYTADAGCAYARPGNRFWPAALEAGLVSRDRDQLAALRDDAVGMTNLVLRATTRAGELAREEYRQGAARVERLVRWLRPRAVCVVGLTGWRAAVDPTAGAGAQPEPFGGRPVYVMPSTSGLNAHARLADLVAHLRAAAGLTGGQGVVRGNATRSQPAPAPADER